ncbi:DgyrCDS3264 [Dimorphilus gyrociliatus]|uniref:Gamma-aminobutyric acid type B receptor subunit 2 n=1 Tax=Dimorphilus gyrociliatus TaxID=2664684 RepID=A0A7I8VEK9_9ANNE|nr:DgyrCDS3264 [Dimorphilus gyrociliatus]
MRQLAFIAFLSCVYSKEEIFIGGLFPLSRKSNDNDKDNSKIGLGILPAVELAMEHVNSHRQILNKQTLRITYNDSMCDMAVGTKLFFDMMNQPPEKLILFGAACSHVTGPIAETAYYWRIPQLSYADTHPELSDRTRYSMFFRTIPSDLDYNPARVKLVKNFGWKRVGTIFQDASKGSSRFAYAHNLFVDLLEQAGVERQIESFSTDPAPAIENLKKKDQRIIIGNFDSEMARKVVCQAYKTNLYGVKYVWILLGDYPKNWWKKGTDGCLVEELEKVLQGYFSTDILPLSSEERKTISNITAQEYSRLYSSSVSSSDYNEFSGYAYDGIWAIALALHKTLNEYGIVQSELRNNSDLLLDALNNTDFIGVTGDVQFRKGDRVGSILLQQMQGGRLVKIGEYHANNDTLNLEAPNSSSIIWPKNKQPRDRTRQRLHLQRVNLTIYAILCTISSIGIIIALVFLGINIKFRNHRYEIIINGLHFLGKELGIYLWEGISLFSHIDNQFILLIYTVYNL